MTAENLEIVFRLVVALLAGAAIGFERSYQGRPAGIRTHALVCTASSLLMLVTAHETRWMHVSSDLVPLDPTRMAQGIMTGIGFLGAGVFFREGRSVRRHSMVIRSPRKASARRLAETLERTESVLEFRISPTGD